MERRYQDQFREAEREVRWTFPRVMKWLLVLMLAGAALGLVGSWLGLFASVASAPARVATRTLETDNIIYNYEWFKSQHERVMALDRQIPLAEHAVRDLESDAPTSYPAQTALAEQRRILQGMRNQRVNYVGEYNARARMANRNIFMGSDLPERLDP